MRNERKISKIQNEGFLKALPTIDYPDISIYELVRRAASRVPDVIAYEFYGKKTTYGEFIKRIDDVAARLYEIGVRKGDRVLICMPNSPQALHMIYATSKLGGIATIIHPLSAKNEILFCLNNSDAKVALVLDAFVNNFIEVKDRTKLEKIIVTSIKDELSLIAKIGYSLTNKKKVPRYEMKDYIVTWKSFLKNKSNTDVPEVKIIGSDPALILYSGGTTGFSKGVLLSNMNLNASSMETLCTTGCFPCRIDRLITDDVIEHLKRKTYSVLSIMPIFHGFGFGVGIHSFLMFGGTCILVPYFTPESAAKVIMKKKPYIIAGVPTFFEKVISQKVMDKADMSFLGGMFCGGDTLSTNMRETINDFLSSHGSDVVIKEGYGLTECVTVACLTPTGQYRKNSIGIPLPDVLFKIVEYGTQRTLECGEEGEICISGPNTMIGYVKDEKTTEIALQRHSDGRVWLHTGDAGTMDEDGFVYFRQRYKRIIVSSGYNIYPSQIEEAVNMFPGVKESCAIAVPDPVRKQRVKVYVTLEKGIVGDEELKKRMIAHCREYVAAYAVPKLFEFIDEMPRTKVGKISYRDVEELDRKKRENQL